MTTRLEHGLLDEVLGSNPRAYGLAVVGRHPLESIPQVLTGSLSTAVLERSRSIVMVVPQAYPAESPSVRAIDESADLSSR